MVLFFAEKKQLMPFTYIHYDNIIYEPKGDNCFRNVLCGVPIHGGAHRDIPLFNRHSPDIGTLAGRFGTAGLCCIFLRIQTCQCSAHDVAGHDSVHTQAAIPFITGYRWFVLFLAESYANGNPYRIDLDKPLWAVCLIGSHNYPCFNIGCRIRRHSMTNWKNTLSRFLDFDGRNADFFQNKFAASVFSAQSYSTTLLDAITDSPYSHCMVYFVSFDQWNNHNSINPVFLASQNSASHMVPEHFDKMKNEGMSVKAEIWEKDKHPSS